MTYRPVYGSKGGSEKPPRQPVESPDNLISIAYARVVDLISEGECRGLVNGDSSILLDETAARVGGSLNFPGFTYDVRNGTQDQTYMPGFPQVENEVTVGLELRTDSPYLRTVSNTDLSALRINFNVPRLQQQNQSNGDLGGYTVQYAIDLAIGAGAYQTVKESAFSGKTTGGYERSERVDLPAGSSGGWRVRVRRVTPEATSSAVTDAIYIKSVTEIIDAKFRYPNSFVVGTSFDAQTFGNQLPKRGFDCYGRIIRVPSNYDPELRLYTGDWDGTFKFAYTNNPAWIFYDLLLHQRFGLGDRINADQVDKWSLYAISQYCDQMVDDGNGALEPRFTCNMYLQKRGDALKVLQDLASIFRGITYWGAGQAYVSADMPSDPVATYTNGRVIKGLFSYKGTKRITRYSVALVNWNDPNDMFRQKTEYVQDDAAVARLGVRQTEITAFACSSQGQAQRAGRWALLTNQLETDSVSFTVALEGLKARPGQVIRVMDNNRAGSRRGGLVHSATVNTVTVDRFTDYAPVAGDRLIVSSTDGNSLQERTVLSVTGRVVTITPNLDDLPVSGSAWALEADALKTQLFRVLTISETSPMQFAVFATRHIPDKYDNVDFGTIISQRPITSIPNSVVPAPANVRAETDFVIDQYAAQTTMTILWDAVPQAVYYDVQWRRGSSDWVYAGRVSTTEVDVVGIYAGDYTLRVKAINALDINSPWGNGGPFSLQGKTSEPPLVVGLRTTSKVFGIQVDWGVPVGAEDTAYTELQYNSAATDVGALALGQMAYPTNTFLLTGLGAAVTLWFRARLIDKTGNIGQWSPWVSGTSSADADEILGYLAGKISETELAQGLVDEIDKISGSGPGSVNERINGLDEELQGQIDSISAQLADIMGAPDWDAGTAYLAGQLVKFDGSIYRAKIDTPAGTPVSNTTYWEKIGDYASIGEMVAALAVRITNVETSVTEINGELTAIATEVTGLYAYVYPPMIGSTGDYIGATTGFAGVWSINAAFASSDLALAQRIDVLEATVGDNVLALIQEEATVRAEADSALASLITTLEATVGDNTAAIEIQAQTLADIDDGLSAMYSIKLGVTVDGKYYGAGMGIGIENTPSGMQSQVLFTADRFALINTANGVISTPFVIQGGQTFINSAIIANASIGFAKISDTVQSDNYVPNVSGWKLGKSGGLEINASVAGGGRVQITNQVVLVYDASGTLRVRMGIWS